VSSLVRQLYSNLVKFASGKGATIATFRELFPPMDVLSDEKVKELEKILGLSIISVSIYEQALMHRSYLQVANKPDHRSNERLEFLGDSILGMITAEYLFYNNKEVLEGELTKMRSWLVNKKTLAICARELHLDQLLLLSYSAIQSLERGNDSMLADALESIIAAVYLDHGFEAARTFIVDKLLPIMVEQSLLHDTNYKSLLLENVQANGHMAPRYLVAFEEGPDHEKQFTVDVYVDEKKLGRGKGRNKKDAEQDAARIALDAMNKPLRKRITPRP
jgi:ribonuclease III